MLGVVVLLATAAGQDVTVAVPALQVVGVDEAVASVYVERLATKLAADDVRVTTARDMAQLLGLERQKALLGCGEESSCVAELAGALGVKALVSGSVARLDSGYVVTLRLLRAPEGTLLSSASERLVGEAALLDFLDDAAVRFREALQRTFGTARPAPSFTRWIPALVGGALATGGAVALVVAATQHQALVSGSLQSRGAIDGAVATGRTAELVGYLLVGGGVASALASVLWVALSPDTVLAGFFTPQAAGLSWTWRVP